MAGLGSIASGVSIGGFFSPRLARASLIPLDDDDAVQDSKERSFQYWPDTITDTKGVEYASKQIPGASHPLKQWVAGGDRDITFTAPFSRDLAKDSSPLQSEDLLARNPDIRTAIAWLRQYLYAAYREADFRVRPPKKLLLHLPNTAIGLGAGAAVLDVLGAGAGSMYDLLPCVMVKCDVTYKAFFPDGTPRLATVDLGFQEIVQYAGQVNFVGRDSFESMGSKYGTRLKVGG